MPLDIEELIQKDAADDDDDENMVKILFSVGLILAIIFGWCRLACILISKKKKKHQQEDIPLRTIREYS